MISGCKTVITVHNTIITATCPVSSNPSMCTPPPSILNQFKICLGQEHTTFLCKVNIFFSPVS